MKVYLLPTWVVKILNLIFVEPAPFCSPFTTFIPSLHQVLRPSMHLLGFAGAEDEMRVTPPPFFFTLSLSQQPEQPTTYLHTYLASTHCIAPMPWIPIFTHHARARPWPQSQAPPSSPAKQVPMAAGNARSRWNQPLLLLSSFLHCFQSRISRIYFSIATASFCDCCSGYNHCCF